MSSLEKLPEVALAFSRLGCVSFGGPIAHLGYLREEFVERRAWLEDADYADLVALCQFLPGPASSQVVFALGLRRAGLLGALVASLCFTFPSALLLLAFASGLARLGPLENAGWLHGLKLAALAVVAQATWGMGKKLCPDRARFSIAVGAAATLLVFPGALAQLGTLVFGGLLGLRVYGGSLPLPDASPTRRIATTAATGALFAFAGLLLALPALASQLEAPALQLFDAFYRSGALVFGGGHVVLPLLRAELVGPGWLDDSTFLAGYGAANAIPGPLFTLAAYLGASVELGMPRLVSGLWCLLGIFLPAWLLVFGALPFWERLRALRWAQASLLGANAAVVGILLAALYDPVFTESVRSGRDVAAAFVGFSLLERWKAPAWAFVLGFAALGAAGLF